MTPEEIATAMLARLNLPENLRGEFVNFVGFPDDRTCRAFYGGRTRDDHEKAVMLAALEVLKRGGRTSRTVIAFTRQVESDAAADYSKHADAYTYLVPKPGSVARIRA